MFYFSHFRHFLRYIKKTHIPLIRNLGMGGFGVDLVRKESNKNYQKKSFSDPSCTQPKEGCIPARQQRSHPPSPEKKDTNASQTVINQPQIKRITLPIQRGEKK